MIHTITVDDLVNRLRRDAKYGTETSDIVVEAADEIERLRAEVESLKEYKFMYEGLCK